MSRSDRRRAYWRRNLQYLFILLTIWFAVSYGCGILLVDELDQIRLGGFKLGFWFAQQGSIYVFVVLIFVYVALMNRLDRQFLDALREDASDLEGIDAVDDRAADDDGTGADADNTTADVADKADAASRDGAPS